MPEANPVIAALEHELVTQLAPISALSIDALAEDGPAPVPQALLALLSRERESIARWLHDVVPPQDRRGGFAADPAHAMALALRGLLQAKDPFLDVGPTRSAALEDAMSRSLAHLRGALDKPLLEAARAAEIAAVARDLRSAVAEYVRSVRVGPTRAETLCTEHSPELQLKLLGLEVDGETALAEPILDLGCGPNALLVKLLRSKGKEAFGVDRVVERQPWVEEADWFDYALGTARWGTIVSHLGFTTHFLHHHLANDREAFRYARRYMEVLRALLPGGTFAYAPGLPFIEAHLPQNEWEIDRRRIELPASALPAQAAVRAAVPLYACRVRRVGA